MMAGCAVRGRHSGRAMRQEDEGSLRREGEQWLRRTEESKVEVWGRKRLRKWVANWFLRWVPRGNENLGKTLLVTTSWKKVVLISLPFVNPSGYTWHAKYFSQILIPYFQTYH